MLSSVFNVTNNQDSIRNLDVVTGTGGVEFGEGIRFNLPRRLILWSPIDVLAQIAAVRTSVSSSVVS